MGAERPRAADGALARNRVVLEIRLEHFALLRNPDVLVLEGEGSFTERYDVREHQVDAFLASQRLPSGQHRRFIFLLHGARALIPDDEPGALVGR
jgi:hypothetical protein